MSETKIAIDKAGRLVLPKAIRERFRLRPGTLLDVDIVEDGVRLRPAATGSPLVRENGWWVHRGAADAEELVDAVNRHRDERLGDLSR
jgi:AbrB family looped-hinge helix DNA binding protein